MPLRSLTIPLCLWLCLATAARASETSLLNVSYDPTRELYRDINAAFAEQWKHDHGQDVSIHMSHGGSGKQARSVSEGLRADVVTLALAYDIDAIAARGWLPKDWQQRLPDQATPYTSTIVFMVRKGNPRHIHDWDDLVRPGIQVITPNPKTSGGARWNFLAAWGYALDKFHGDEAQTRAFVRNLYKHVPVLDAGARGATTTFAQRGIGDVLVGWENEAMLAKARLGDEDFEIVRPSLSILAEPPVAMVDRNVDRHGTRALAQAYLAFLYSPQGQQLAAKNFYRPRSMRDAGPYAAQFPPIRTFTLAQVFGNWHEAQERFFRDGGEFDRFGANGGL
ncbi:sulfate ABC transporter substrate-binding protein [Dyella sp.]|uniref:sulfate ABC transporter substrate-binding protein n=1 Tax=Dyella sp. TaxID=1869338 RepID=UPI002ED13C67